MLLAGKGAEILKTIAMHGPCSQYFLRGKKHWSSRTVWKQIHKLEEDGLIHRSVSGYEVTDRGFYVLISVTALTSASEARTLLTKAAAKYPDGKAQKNLGWMSKPPPKRDMERTLIEYARKPNVFVACLTDVNGKISSLSVMDGAVDTDTGRLNYKVLMRLPSGRWRTSISA